MRSWTSRLLSWPQLLHTLSTSLPFQIPVRRSCVGQGRRVSRASKRTPGLIWKIAHHFTFVGAKCRFCDFSYGHYTSQLILVRLELYLSISLSHSLYILYTYIYYHRYRYYRRHNKWKGHYWFCVHRAICLKKHHSIAHHALSEHISKPHVSSAANVSRNRKGCSFGGSWNLFPSLFMLVFETGSLFVQHNRCNMST